MVDIEDLRACGWGDGTARSSAGSFRGELGPADAVGVADVEAFNGVDVRAEDVILDPEGVAGGRVEVGRDYH